MSFFDRFRRKKERERLETLGRRDTEKNLRVEKKPVAAPQRSSGTTAARVLLHPVQSEKATKLLERNHYVFAVAGTATKTQVRRAINELYGVKPQSVSVLNRKGRYVRYGRTEGRTSAQRKAVVVLKKGDSITLTQS